MKRREFITLVGGAAAAWPFAARAQQTGPMRRIGVLMGYAEADPEAKAVLSAFTQRLSELGWTDGHNVRIEVRWIGDDLKRLKTDAAELVASAPDVIFCSSTPVAAEMLRLTRTIPIVFVQVADPVSVGFVTNLARPGGNITGSGWRLRGPHPQG